MTESDPQTPPPAPEPEPERASEPAAPPPPKRAKRVHAVPIPPGPVSGPTIDVQAVAQPIPAPAVEPPAQSPSPPPAAAPADPGPPPASGSEQSSPPAGAVPPPAVPPSAPPAAQASPSRKRWWVAACHLAYLVPVHIPGLIVTTAIWMWRRARDPLLADQGREALNMQLTFWLVNLLLGLTCLGGPLVVFVWFVGAILCILAAVQSAGGERHRYPWILRIIA